MKRQFLSVLALASCAIFSASRAETSPPAARKTRAQVLAELCSAEQAGLVPFPDGSYPPDLVPYGHS